MHDTSVVLDCQGCRQIKVFHDSNTAFDIARAIGWRIPYHNEPPYVCPTCAKKYLKQIQNIV